MEIKDDLDGKLLSIFKLSMVDDDIIYISDFNEWREVLALKNYAALGELTNQISSEIENSKFPNEII
jgi:hypothetical protein